MKKIILIIFLLPFTAMAQRDSIAGIGITAGYSNLKLPTAEIYTKYKLKKGFIFHPLTFRFHASNSACVPVIIGTGMGYQILKPLEIYGSLNFHAAGQDGKEEFKQYRGFRPAGGFYLHLAKYLVISGNISGDIKTIGIGF